MGTDRSGLDCGNRRGAIERVGFCRVRIELENLCGGLRPVSDRLFRHENPPGRASTKNSQSSSRTVSLGMREVVRSELQNFSVPPAPSPAENGDQETVPPARAPATLKNLSRNSDATGIRHGRLLRQWLAEPAGWDWLALLATPFLSLASTAAMIPPGMLWTREEPHGYDVVEYHLQAPREWFECIGLCRCITTYFPTSRSMWQCITCLATTSSRRAVGGNVSVAVHAPDVHGRCRGCGLWPCPVRAGPAVV